MSKFTIKIDTIDKVKSFINDISNVPFDVLASNGRYTVDAKSIMGILSLDFSKPIEIYPADDTADNHDTTQALLEAVQFYL